MRIILRKLKSDNWVVLPYVFAYNIHMITSDLPDTESILEEGEKYVLFNSGSCK